MASVTLNKANSYTTSVTVGPAWVAECVKTLGPDRPDTLSSRHSLAYAYEAVGRTDEAIELYGRTLADRERALGPDHPDTLTSRHSLAYACQVVSHTDEAMELKASFTLPGEGGRGWRSGRRAG